MSTRPAFSSPVGTHDVLPPESARWEALASTFAGVVECAGYGLLQSPAFEDIGVFQRVGEGTDVVRKEMYDFADKGGRHVALRPEGTASVARAYVQHHPAVSPWKVWYAAPCFRYERPQAGRLRQHHQVGVEALGSADPDLDVEVITLGYDYLRALGLRRLALVVNSMGTRGDRAAYVVELRSWLAAHRDALDPDDRDKVDSHPLRVLDSKRPATRAAVAEAPQLSEHLSDGAAAHLSRVREGLDAAGIEHTVDPRLVRGLDYYTHTTFEFVAEALDAAQSTVLGGGRYDGLVEELGGPPTAGVGFGSGIERVLLACDAEGVFGTARAPLDVFVIDLTGGSEARDLSTELRRAGLRVDRAFDARSARAQMKAADRSGASLAVLVGTDEVAAGTVTVRNLRRDDAAEAASDGDAQWIVARDGLLAALRSTLDANVPPATDAAPASSLESASTVPELRAEDRP